MSDESLSGTTCRLIREDGSEWIVTRFDLREGGAWITARRMPECASVPSTCHGADLAAHATEDGTHLGNGHAAENSYSRPEANGAERLYETPLRHGDRLVWTRRDGTVAWAMRNPTGVGIEWRHQDVDDDQFFAGDFR
ncbi:MAG: hypothetical protein Q8W51_05845 [Candidatus Palauibacterales bacterium]|nr:hypothetical protein [Candidatus Palauibacterales bacterium]MDP2529240.1 hypothetical protein [Candidatus Palauibacterales bacterium]MDP2583651.1 hypothetical protein [Candidatus Palauibacterales bacterium]